MSDRVEIGRSKWDGRGYLDDALDQPNPPVPVFDETLEELAGRLRRLIGHVRNTRDLSSPCASIAKLLKQDERRRQRQAESSWLTWDSPLFESPFERRRLALLESVSRGLGKVTATLTVDGREGRQLLARVGDQWVSFNLDAVGAKPGGILPSVNKAKSALLRLDLMSRHGEAPIQESWTDATGARLETRLADIVLAIVVQAERQHREGEHSRREYIIKRKAEVAEEQQRAELDRQRLERERLAQLEKAKVDRLLSEAASLRIAQEVRAFVEAVRGAKTSVPAETLDHWVAWAFAQADKIDPIRNETFLAALDHDVVGVSSSPTGSPRHG